MLLCSGQLRGEDSFPSFVTSFCEEEPVGTIERGMRALTFDVCDRNEYLNSKPGRETEAAQEMDSVTS